MYISEHLLHSKNYKNSKTYLKELLKDCLNNMSELYLKDTLDFDKSIKTIAYINTFNELNNLPLIKFNSSDIHYSQNLLNLIENCYNELLYENNDIYPHPLMRSSDISSNNSKYDLIQNNINELRDNLIKSDLFNKENREKILQRLESIQNELNTIMSNFDNSLDKVLLNIKQQIKDEDLSSIESKLYLEYKIKKII